MNNFCCFFFSSNKLVFLLIFFCFLKKLFFVLHFGFALHLKTKLNKTMHRTYSMAAMSQMNKHLYVFFLQASIAINICWFFFVFFFRERNMLEFSSTNIIHSHAPYVCDHKNESGQNC